VSGAEL